MAALVIIVFSVPYHDRRPLRGLLYRLVALARLWEYYSGRFSFPAGSSILCGIWWLRQEAPATGAIRETCACADRWALCVAGCYATPIKTEHLDISSGRGRFILLNPVLRGTYFNKVIAVVTYFTEASTTAYLIKVSAAKDHFIKASTTGDSFH